MPTSQLKSLANEYGVSLDVAEGFWDKAREQYGEDWPKVVGTVKVMLKNHKKSKNESYIQKALTTLTECDSCGCKGDKKKCKCGGKCGGKCGDNCKCKKMEEGKAKRDLEQKVEKSCSCGAGASLSMKDHSKKCKAKEYLIDA